MKAIMLVSFFQDPTNLNGKLQKHTNFQKELVANKTRIDGLLASGRGLVESDQHGTDRVNPRLEAIVSLWDALEDASAKKESRLNEAGSQQQFNRTVEDIELWLSEVEGSLASEDYGKDLTSVQNLQKKHTLLESDVSGHQERIDAIRQTAQEFIDMGHFDKDNIKRKADTVETRYANLMRPIEVRRKKLADSLRVQQLFRDIEDEEAWIREKEPIAGSNNRGRDLIGVQNLIKKHQAVLSEIANHEPRVNAVCESGQSLAESGQFQSDEVKARIGKLKEHWNQLKEVGEKRKRDLDDALLVRIF